MEMNKRKKETRKNSLIQYDMQNIYIINNMCRVWGNNMKQNGNITTRAKTT